MKLLTLKQLIALITALVICLIFLLYLLFNSNDKNQSTNSDKESAKIVRDTIIHSDTLIVHDTLIMYSSDTLYFDVSEPKPFVNNTKFTTPFVMNIPELSTFVPLKIYTDSINNDDGTFVSTVVTSGKLHSHTLLYELSKEVINTNTTIKTDTVFTNTLHKRNLFQAYVGASVSVNTFDPVNIEGIRFAPTVSLLIKEKCLTSYSFDVTSNRHQVTLQFRVFNKNKTK
jgi:hypothetical protein